jgi:hypothetical protein
MKQKSLVHAVTGLDVRYLAAIYPMLTLQSPSYTNDSGLVWRIVLLAWLLLVQSHASTGGPLNTS